jgi:hypothetical protein
VYIERFWTFICATILLSGFAFDVNFTFTVSDQFTVARDLTELVIERVHFTKHQYIHAL